MTTTKHQPVMLQAVLEALAIEKSAWYLDATFGHGGHTREILTRGGQVLALDFDQAAIKSGQAEFADEIKNQQLILLQSNFDQLATVVQEQNLSTQIAGVLLDFGTNLEQLTSPRRGLSFQNPDQELDMRLDQTLGVKAKDLLAVMDRHQLQRVFSEFGGEREAKTLAVEIVNRRKEGQFITTVGELVDLIAHTKRHHPPKIHPATKVFQALRIAVNDELGNIERALPQALAVISPGGKIVTIAFHEGEDRLVKNYFRTWEESSLGTANPRGVIKPPLTEITQNPQARSAKMRVFSKK